MILVTGGLGYIGSHTTTLLLEKGYKVLAVDNLSNTHSGVLDQIEKACGLKPIFEQKDVAIATDVEYLFKKYPIKGVIHFAAYKAVGESVEKPLSYYKNNLFSLIYILESMKKHGVSNLIFSSSCTVYGEAKTSPIDENAAILPANSPYGNTKQIGEEIISDFIKSTSEIQAISLRYFNPIGAHPSIAIGELPNGVPQNLVPFITQTAAGIRKELSVFGDDYPTPDGSAVRDYIYVMDLADAHILALEKLLEKSNKTPYDTINLGTGKGSSVLEVIKQFEQASNQKLNYKIAPRREGDVTAIWADTSKAYKVLGWSAKTNLKEALRTSWEWQKTLQ